MQNLLLFCMWMRYGQDMLHNLNDSSCNANNQTGIENHETIVQPFYLCCISIKHELERKPRIWVLYHVTLMFDEALRISQITLMDKVFDSQPLLPGCRPISETLMTCN